MFKKNLKNSFHCHWKRLKPSYDLNHKNPFHKKIQDKPIMKYFFIQQMFTLLYPKMAFSLSFQGIRL